VFACVLRPRPISSVAGRRVAFFTTAPEEAHDVLAAHLRTEHAADVVGVSGNLARRDDLREDIDRVDAEVYLVEIKAAAIDVVAEEAERRGVELVFADNDVLPLPGEADLDEEVRRLVA
jgi:cyclic 2,3-diphosphoglycerate synthase